MPQIFRFGDYWIYFWTNENKPLEPIHIHVAKGAPTANATKNMDNQYWQLFTL